MSQRPTVFIHTSLHETLAAKVAAYSHISVSKNKESFDLKIICIEDYPELLSHHGDKLVRSGRQGAWYKDVPQSFLPLRFIVPELMSFQGRAILTDPDIFAVSDIFELIEKDMQGKAILSRPVGNPIQSWNSSVMLLDCEKLQHWKWHELLDRIFSNEIDFQDLISLRTEKLETLGSLEEEWNSYDTLNSRTKLLHNTRQITQPWKTGLPYIMENMSNYDKSRKKTFKEKLETLAKASLKGKPKYKKHPDPRQEELFMALLKEGIYSGFIESNLLASEVKSGHVRADIVQVMESISRTPLEIISELRNIHSH